MYNHRLHSSRSIRFPTPTVVPISGLKPYGWSNFLSIETRWCFFFGGGGRFVFGIFVLGWGPCWLLDVMMLDVMMLLVVELLFVFFFFRGREGDISERGRGGLDGTPEFWICWELGVGGICCFKGAGHNLFELHSFLIQVGKTLENERLEPWKSPVCKRKTIFQTFTFGFHVNFQGWIKFNSQSSLPNEDFTDVPAIQRPIWSGGGTIYEYLAILFSHFGQTFVLYTPVDLPFCLLQKWKYE